MASKALVWGIGLTVVGVGALALAGGGSGGAPGRAPYTGSILVPGRNAPWDAVDEALCLCTEAGDGAGPLGAVRLWTCVLKRLWPEVPWPARKGDNATVVETQRVVVERSDAFRNALARGERPCDIDPVQPPVQPPGGGWDPVDPFPDTIRTDAFARIVSNSNPTKVVRAALGLAAGDARIASALRCVVATGFNLYFYSRPRQAGTYGAAKIGSKTYDIGPAWLPANTDVRDAFNTGDKLVRQVSWSGGKLHAGAYGSPWIPAMELLQSGVDCPGAGPWDPARNPPAEYLAKLGHTLEAMRATWEASNA